MSGIADSIKGKIKEVAGKLSGDHRTEAAGRTDQVKGKVKQTAEELEQTAKGVADSLEEETDSTGKPGGSRGKADEAETSGGASSDETKRGG